MKSSLINNIEFDDRILFEQYKLYVELMDRVSSRRQIANTFFLTANTTILTVLSVILSISNKDIDNLLWLLFACATGILFCLVWNRLINSYRELNTGKFQVIHLLEQQMPARMFEAEWEFLHQGDGTKYLPFTLVERLVPFVFIVFYLALFVMLIIPN